MPGLLVVFEGLDQSGKQTQAETLRDRLTAAGHECHLESFPDYTTPIGVEIGLALRGDREYGPEAMQLLYVANRHERQPDMAAWLAAGHIVICDRYRASSIAYGEAFGLDPEWLSLIQQRLPRPDLTILLDIPPSTAVGRKSANRDKFERDTALLERVRASYRRQAAAGGWLVLDGERPRDVVAADVVTAVTSRLARP